MDTKPTCRLELIKFAYGRKYKIYTLKFILFNRNGEKEIGVIFMQKIKERRYCANIV